MTEIVTTAHVINCQKAFSFNTQTRVSKIIAPCCNGLLANPMYQTQSNNKESSFSIGIVYKKKGAPTYGSLNERRLWRRIVFRECQLPSSSYVPKF